MNDNQVNSDWNVRGNHRRHSIYHLGAHLRRNHWASRTHPKMCSTINSTIIRGREYRTRKSSSSGGGPTRAYDIAVKYIQDSRKLHLVIFKNGKISSPFERKQLTIFDHDMVEAIS